MTTEFIPSKHGWPFSNIWPSDWIMTHTEIYSLEILVPIRADFGLYGGMCWAALDRYLFAVK